MSFKTENGKNLELSALYKRKATRLARIEMLKSEIRSIEKLISEKEQEE